MSIDGITGAGPLPRLALEPAERDEAEARLEAMRKVAVDFEAVFLAQMLDHAGVGRTPEGFGGGVGEEAFRTHLIAEQARLMAGKGGIGVADTIFAALAEREGLTP